MTDKQKIKKALDLIEKVLEEGDQSKEVLNALDAAYRTLEDARSQM